MRQGLPIKILFFFIFFISHSLFAQDGKMKNQWHLGVVTTAGLSSEIAHLSVSTRYQEIVSLRGGISFIPTLSLQDISIKGLDLSLLKEELGYTPILQSNGSYSAINGHLLADWYPFQGIGIRVSTGFYFRMKHQIQLKARLESPTGKPAFKDLKTINPDFPVILTLSDKKNPQDKISIQPSEDGSLALEAILGNTIQPYLGIGYGYAVPRSRVSFFFDLGMRYYGKSNLFSPNIIEGNPNDLIDYERNIQEIAYKLQFLPSLTLGLSVRIF